MANGMPSMNSAGMGELFARLRFVLIALLIYRIGTHIPVPGIDPEQLASLFDQNQGTILGLANVFSGGALGNLASPRFTLFLQLFKLRCNGVVRVICSSDPRHKQRQG